LHKQQLPLSIPGIDTETQVANGLGFGQPGSSPITHKNTPTDKAKVKYTFLDFLKKNQEYSKDQKHHWSHSGYVAAKP